MSTTNQLETEQLEDNSITYTKIQMTASADVVLGRDSSGVGDVMELTCTAFARSILDDVAASNTRTTLGLGTLATQSGTFSGTHSGTSSGTNTGDQTITLTGNVTGSGTGSFATTIAAGVVTEAMQVLANNTTQDVSTSKHGYAPVLPNDSTKFLNGIGTYTVPPGGGSGSVTTVSVVTANGVSGSVANATTTPAITLTLAAITPTTVDAAGSVKATVTAVGTSIATDGVAVINTTAAAVGAQQYSPQIRLTGQGWKTAATAASQQCDWFIQNRTIQGTAAPNNQLAFSSKIGSAGTADQVLFTTGGGISALSFTSTNVGAGFVGDGNLLAGVGRLTGIQTFTSGSGTYTPTAGTTIIRVCDQGSGGGGGGGAGGSGTAGAGAGGGGGGYCEKVITSLAASYDYSIGTGGSGASAGNNSGTDGTDTTFSAHGGAAILTGSGGVGGPSIAAGTSVVNSSAAAGGTGTGGTLNIAGGAGGRGSRFSGTQALGGRGGDSILGRGGYIGINLAGNAASGYGGGGAGGSASGSNTAGGAGTDGIVIIYEYA